MREGREKQLKDAEEMTGNNEATQRGKSREAEKKGELSRKSA